MHRFWILPALLLVITTPSQAGKLYKIVDADGQVTFSQYPPAEKSEHAIIEDIKLSGTTQATVSQVGNSLYCGETRLPNPPVSHNKRAFYKTLFTSKNAGRHNSTRSKKKLSGTITHSLRAAKTTTATIIKKLSAASTIKNAKIKTFKPLKNCAAPSTGETANAMKLTTTQPTTARKWPAYKEFTKILNRQYRFTAA